MHIRSVLDGSDEPARTEERTFVFIKMVVQRTEAMSRALLRLDIVCFQECR